MFWNLYDGLQVETQLTIVGWRQVVVDTPRQCCQWLNLQQKEQKEEESSSQCNDVYNEPLAQDSPIYIYIPDSSIISH